MYCLDSISICSVQELNSYMDGKYFISPFWSRKILRIPGVTEAHIRRFVDPDIWINENYPNWIIHVLINMGRKRADFNLLDRYADDDIILKFAADRGCWSKNDATTNKLLDLGYRYPRNLSGLSLNYDYEEYSLATRQRVYDSMDIFQKTVFRERALNFCVDNDGKIRPL